MYLKSTREYKMYTSHTCTMEYSLSKLVNKDVNINNVRAKTYNRK